MVKERFWSGCRDEKKEKRKDNAETQRTLRFAEKIEGQPGAGGEHQQRVLQLGPGESR
jgi:hypothetical protein